MTTASVLVDNIWRITFAARSHADDLDQASKLPFDPTFSRCGVGRRRVFSAQGINRLFHLKARKPFDVAGHVSRCIDASLSATSRITLPVFDDLRTGIVFLLHAANKRLLGARAKYTRDGSFRFPTGCLDIDGWQAG